ncbi:MAG: hypothetical protein ABJA66_10985 [Actinomycetota bacterium]
MKYLLFFIIPFLLTLTIHAQISVAINNGYGSGNYKNASRLIHVWAAANPPNMVFDKWTGDTDLLLDVSAWHTRVSLKKKNITLTATYKAAPAWNPTYEAINGRQYGFFFPPNIRGLVFRFHGTGGFASTFFNKVEDRSHANDFVAAGFAVVALDSDDRVNKQWSTALPPNNVDINNVQAIINSFISRGFITTNTPIFSTGMSNGGAFSPRVAYALQFKAAAIYCAPGSTFINITNIPTIWNMEQYDDNDNVGSAGNATAFTNSQILANRGIIAQYNLNIPSPVYPQRFARIPGLTLSDSQTIYNSLKNNGFLDRDNYLSEDPNTSGWQSVVPIVYVSYIDEITDQLNVCFTAHKFFSDYDSRVIAFFNARL